MRAIAVLVIAYLLAGCQTVEVVEYYEPTPDTITATDGAVRGAIKSEYRKKGVADPSDGKAIHVSGVGI